LDDEQNHIPDTAFHPEVLLPISPPAHPDKPVPFCSGFLLFLPVSEKRSDKRQTTKEDTDKELKAIIAQVGAAGPKDMGKVMGVASKALAGRAEGRMISETVKRLLN
jgi:hypothetical protein